MNTHTPGPWVLSGPTNKNTGNEFERVWSINGMHKCDGFSNYQDCRLASVFSSEENAHLIAASPDLLAALQSMMDYFIVNNIPDSTFPDDTVFCNLEKQAMAAIAKSKGEA